MSALLLRKSQSTTVRPSWRCAVSATTKAERQCSTFDWFGSSNWARTSDPLINSQMLCQLSYGRIWKLFSLLAILDFAIFLFHAQFSGLFCWWLPCQLSYARISRESFDSLVLNFVSFCKLSNTFLSYVQSEVCPANWAIEEYILFFHNSWILYVIEYSMHLLAYIFLVSFIRNI